MECLSIAVQLEMAHVLRKQPSHLRFLLLGKQIASKIKVALVHLNVNVLLLFLFFSLSDLNRLLLSRCLITLQICNGTDGSTPEKGRGLRSIKATSNALGLEHMFDLNNTFAELECQVPLVILVQRTAVLCEVLIRPRQPGERVECQ